ncbi:MAG: hypothetical protein GXO31_05280 [Epsilonproteobacteria bacterium]|nr:hypothetical protein [Campylobacterota bacterium]
MKTYRFERRTPSVIKPFFYLFLQLIAVFESYFIIKLYLDIKEFSAIEIAPFYILSIYFGIRTFKILQRQTKK